MAHKDHNIMSEHGITDQDYVEQFDAPQDLVGTPGINDFMINKVYNDNVMSHTETLIADGMEEQAARTMAMKDAGKARDAARQNLAKVRKQRGY